MPGTGLSSSRELNTPGLAVPSMVISLPWENLLTMEDTQRTWKVMHSSLNSDSPWPTTFQRCIPGDAQRKTNGWEVQEQIINQRRERTGQVKENDFSKEKIAINRYCLLLAVSL